MAPRYYNDSSSSDDDEPYCALCNRSFVSQAALDAHLTESSRHDYCLECRREFADANALRNHLNSKRHQPDKVFCPRCRTGFVSASAFTKHVEAGRCYDLSNRDIVRSVRKWEDQTGNVNLLTQCRRLGCCEEDEIIGLRTKNYATEESFNGYFYACPLCDKEFERLNRLNQHLGSNVHEPSDFRCRKCFKEFRELSALVAHVESEVCGAMSARRMTNIITNFGRLSLRA